MSASNGSHILEPGIANVNNDGSSGGNLEETPPSDAMDAGQSSIMPPMTPRTKHRITRSMRPARERDDISVTWQFENTATSPLSSPFDVNGNSTAGAMPVYEETPSAPKPAGQTADIARENLEERDVHEAPIQNTEQSSMAPSGAIAPQPAYSSIQMQYSSPSANKISKMTPLPQEHGSLMPVPPSEPSQERKRQKPPRGNRKRGQSDADAHRTQFENDDVEYRQGNSSNRALPDAELLKNDIGSAHEPQNDASVRAYRHHHSRTSNALDMGSPQKNTPAPQNIAQPALSTQTPATNQGIFPGGMPPAQLRMAPGYDAAAWDQRSQAIAEMMLQAQWAQMPWANQAQFYRPPPFDDDHGASAAMRSSLISSGFPQGMVPNSFFGYGPPQNGRNNMYTHAQMQQYAQHRSPSSQRHDQSNASQRQQQQQMAFMDPRFAFPGINTNYDYVEEPQQKGSSKRSGRKQKRSATMSGGSTGTSGIKDVIFPSITPQGAGNIDNKRNDDQNVLNDRQGTPNLPPLQSGNGFAKQQQQQNETGAPAPVFPPLLQSHSLPISLPPVTTQAGDSVAVASGVANENRSSTTVASGNNAESGDVQSTAIAAQTTSAMLAAAQTAGPLINYTPQNAVVIPIGFDGGAVVSAPNQAAVSPAPTAGEKERIATIHSLGILDSGDQPRLNKITQMTARLLGGACCVLSIVDTDKVIWKSVFWSGGVLPIKEEARYESFCSWVVQDETGRGITILDSKVDPRCVHMRVKPGLEFYAGVPLTTVDRKRIGALSIRGSPRTQFSVMDMNILHEMAFWATGELETISQKRELDSRETMLKAQLKLARMIEISRNIEKTGTSGVVEKALGTIREALRASVVLLLRFSGDTSNIKAALHGYSSSPNIPVSLTIGEEIFYDLALMTLRKEPSGAALHLDSLMTGPVTKDVDHYLNKSIVQCTSELVWGNNRPTGVIAAFFEGQFRFLTSQELGFVGTSASMLSSILERVDLADAFMQTHSFTKILSQSLKKHSSQFGQTQGLAPVFVLIEPIFPPVKGCVPFFDEKDDTLAGSTAAGFSPTAAGSLEQVSNKGPKGQAHAQVIAQLNDMESVMGTNSAKDRDPVPVPPAPAPGTTIELEKATQQLTPIESVEMMSDFAQMLDVLADRLAIKRAKRCGNMFAILGNIGPESGTPEIIASFAHELFFTLDVYNRKTRRNIKARVGIHCDFVPVDFASENQTLKDLWFNMVHFTYKLETMTDSTLVSDIFYHQTKEKCTYEQASPITIRGQGSFMTYRLIGMVLAAAETGAMEVQAFVVPKENGVNNGGSLITQKLVATGTSVTQPVSNVATGGKDSGATTGGSNAVAGNGNGSGSNNIGNTSGNNASGGGSNVAGAISLTPGEPSKNENDGKGRPKKGSRACSIM